jgi:hypothetical protein
MTMSSGLRLYELTFISPTTFSILNKLLTSKDKMESYLLPKSQAMQRNHLDA